MINTKNIIDNIPDNILFGDSEDPNLFYEYSLTDPKVKDGKITFTLDFIGYMIPVKNRRKEVIGYIYCDPNKRPMGP